VDTTWLKPALLPAIGLRLVLVILIVIVIDGTELSAARLRLRLRSRARVVWAEARAEVGLNLKKDPGCALRHTRDDTTNGGANAVPIATGIAQLPELSRSQRNQT